MKLLFAVISFYFLFGIEAHLIYAQLPSSNKKAQQAYETANKNLRLQQTDLAISHLEKAVELDPNFATAYQQLADIHRQTENYIQAIPYYKSVLKLDPNLTPLTKYGLGESLLNEGKYHEAIAYLQDYAKNNLSEKSRMQIDKYIADCLFAINHTDRGIVHLQKLPTAINTSDDEYFPKLTADNKTIVFTRKVNNQENFFESELGSNNWSEARKLTGKINSEAFNEGAHCISPDGKYLFFTGCNRPNGMGSCDIYVSKKENGEWGTPHNLGAPINTKGWESQPAISADGKTLYFVSNRTGGIGGYDIWKSTLNESGKWGNPENLGKEINTPFDESAPYIHADNKTLYFASNGWPGFGRLDLFLSHVDTAGNWSHPENLGKPINNHYNQTAIHVSMNGKLGYLASQDSSRQLDIYAFQLSQLIMPDPVAYIQGQVLDAEDNQPLAAKISVTNTDNQQVVYEDIADYVDGKFIATLPIGFNYAVHVQHQGYLFDSKQYALDDLKFTNEKFETNILLQPIKIGGTITLNNIYFDINKYELLSTSKSDLMLLLAFLKLNPDIIIEVSGHTDNTGKKELNQKLSENRAIAVANYLFANGIAKNRITTLGLGDQKPIATNETNEGKQLNRRTEIKILK
ncbi:tetratricopeptide repeat protein [Sphingobacterium olei]|uniref:Tetratricopeptide repeat protein n=1 Tax=Sphingobacterium olei TaxID=2571155 RepID=A0A4U0P5W8_9SPHI|nr:OmpA family protein [Sphingobacterium olei]TJZ62807.1 tetratricopeptide repeat protein [Sphingobacterium olei]